MATPESTITAAERTQAELRERLDLTQGLPAPARTVAGLDISYAKDSDHAVAAAVLIDVDTVTVVESALVHGEIDFPYVPGLLAFREVPLLRAALGRLTAVPDVLMCDGYGIAHPRRFGLACHLGVLTGLPSFGVAKTPFTATAGAGPGEARGAWVPLRDGDEILGRAVRTRPRVKPVFVSIGHRITLDEATALTVHLSPHYRIPEPTRQADQISRTELRTSR